MCNFSCGSCEEKIAEEQDENEEYIEKYPYEFEITFSDLDWKLVHWEGDARWYEAEWERECPLCGSNVSATFTALESPRFQLLEIKQEGSISLASGNMNKLFLPILEDEMRADSCVDDL